MSNICKTVTLRTRKIKGGEQLSFYLDYYPGYRDESTMKVMRHESLGIYIYAKPKNQRERDYNERMREKYGDDDEDGIEFDDDEDEEPLDNYYGSCYEINRDTLSKLRYDEPDDGCLSPRMDYRITEWDKFLTDGYDNNCDNGDHFFTRLRNIDSEGFSINDIMKAVFSVTGCSRISGRKLHDELGISLSEAEHLLNIFETAGYVSEKDSLNTRKVYISDMSLDELL